MIRSLLLKTSLLLVIVILNSGCVNRATATPYPAADLLELKSVYVTKLAADGRGINNIIADKLRTMGYEVNTGTMPPPGVDIVVTYADKWMWDITMYMLELTVVVREPETNYPLATGNSMHTSLTRKSPKEMVDEVINNIFKHKGVINDQK
jgi:hypothetical protein